jgi:endonuclease YncB( thermonuclease family)
LWLQNWLGEKEISCRILSKVERGWVTGACFADEGKYDVAAVVVNAGWAVAYTQNTRIYVPYEQQAAEAHRGLWRGEFYKPWDWRKMQNRKVKIKINAPKQTNKKSGKFWGLF